MTVSFQPAQGTLKLSKKHQAILDAAKRVEKEGAKEEDFATFIANGAGTDSKDAMPSKLLIKKGQVWWQVLEAVLQEAAANASVPEKEGMSQNPTPQDVEKMRKEGKAKLEEQVALYHKEAKLSKSDAVWMKTVMKDGTASDRCSALTLAFQQSPVHGLEHLKALLAIAQSHNRHDSLLALDAIKETFGDDEIKLLPAGRKLLYIHQQPLRMVHGLDRVRPLAAMLWVVEETLKQIYLDVIRLLEVLSQDAITYSRERACRHLFDLLKNGSPVEQAQNILTLLCNKLGDGERRLASRIPFYLTELVNAHPQQLTLLACEHVKAVVDRKGVSDKTRYYALTFLVQIRLSPSQPGITAVLLQIYFGLFQQYIVDNLQAASKPSKYPKRDKRIRQKKRARGEEPADSATAALNIPAEHARMARILLTGINRAFPFAVEASTAPSTANKTTTEAHTGANLKHLLLQFSQPLLKMCATTVALPTTLQALQLLLLLAPTGPDSLKNQIIKEIETILAEQVRLRSASASHALFLRVFHQLVSIGKGGLVLIKDEKHVGQLLKSLLRFCLSVISPAFTVGALAVTGDSLQRRPGVRASMLQSAPENIADARDQGLWELIALSRHYHPRVRRLAGSLLKCGALPALNPSSADALVHQKPFEYLSLTTLLAAWTRMDRKSQLGKDDRDLNRVMADAEEFDFIHHFAALKDSTSKTAADSAADLDAEADRLMEEEIARGAIDDEDIDFGSDGDDDEDDGDEDFDFGGSEDENSDCEGNDLDAAADDVFMDADDFDGDI